MSKRTISLWFIIGAFVVAGAILAIISSMNNINSMTEFCTVTYANGQNVVDQDCVARNIHANQSNINTALLIIFLNVPFYIAWIGTLLNLARARDWGWIMIVIFLNYVGILLYLIAGPQPLPKGQQAPVMAPYGVYPYPPPASPALQILQERFARGEIDSATYERMREQLRS